MRDMISVHPAAKGGRFAASVPEEGPAGREGVGTGADVIEDVPLSVEITGFFECLVISRMMAQRPQSRPCHYLSLADPSMCLLDSRPHSSHSVTSPLFALVPLPTALDPLAVQQIPSELFLNYS